MSKQEQSKTKRAWIHGLLPGKSKTGIELLSARFYHEKYLTIVFVCDENLLKKIIKQYKKDKTLPELKLVQREDSLKERDKESTLYRVLIRSVNCKRTSEVELKIFFENREIRYGVQLNPGVPSNFKRKNLNHIGWLYSDDSKSAKPNQIEFSKVEWPNNRGEMKLFIKNNIFINIESFKKFVFVGFNKSVNDFVEYVFIKPKIYISKNIDGTAILSVSSTYIKYLGK
jgi:hypothetical protein